MESDECPKMLLARVLVQSRGVVARGGDGGGGSTAPHFFGILESNSNVVDFMTSSLL